MEVRDLPHAVVRPGPRFGHTLIEMMIVITIVACISALAIPRLNYGVMRLDANARGVRATLQQAWRLSIQKQHDVIVSFDATKRSMRTLEDLNNNRAMDTGERVMWRPLEEGAMFTTPPSRVGGAASPAAIAGVGVHTIDGLPSIIFHRNGAASGDAEVYLSAMARGKVERRAILVAQATGRTDWYKYLNGAWRMGGL